VSQAVARRRRIVAVAPSPPAAARRRFVLAVAAHRRPGVRRERGDQPNRAAPPLRCPRGRRSRSGSTGPLDDGGPPATPCSTAPRRSALAFHFPKLRTALPRTTAGALVRRRRDGSGLGLGDGRAGRAVARLGRPGTAGSSLVVSSGNARPTKKGLAGPLSWPRARRPILQRPADPQVPARSSPAAMVSRQNIRREFASAPTVPPTA